MLAYNGDKFLLDGQAPTSYTWEPHPGPSYDLPTWNPDTLKSVVKQLHRAGHRMAFHVMGDRAIDLALDAIEEAVTDTPRPNHRHRLERCVIPTVGARARMKRLGVLASMQPHALYESGESLSAIWGPERTERIMPLRSFLDEGITFGLGSDFPTIPELSPQLTLWAAVARRTVGGTVINGQERITIQAALRAHTMGSAYAAFEEHIKGSIEVGKVADLDVWSDDFYAVPTEQLRTARAVMPIVGGRVMHSEGEPCAGDCGSTPA